MILVAFLNKNSISSASYHAGIDNEQRNRIQKSWTENNIRVIVVYQFLWHGNKQIRCKTNCTL